MTHPIDEMAERLHSVRGGVGRRRQGERSRSAESAQGHRPACHNVPAGTGAQQCVGIDPDLERFLFAVPLVGL